MTASAQKSILIVEDEPDLCEMLAFEFANRGFCAYRAGDGREALDILRGFRPDVVVSDIRMPDVDGFDVLDKVKREDVNSPVVILISAYSDIAPHLSYHRGAEAIFTKPFRLAALVEAVQRLTRPQHERWAAAPREAPWRRLWAKAASLEEGRERRIVDVGRGGVCLASQERDMVCFERTVLDVAWDHGPLDRIEGVGVIRWDLLDDNDPLVCYYGVELEYVSDDTRGPLISWLDTARPIPYIPAFRDI